MICYNEILNREDIKNDIINKLEIFEKQKNIKTIKRGFFITGANGTGKTEFIKNILKELNYDILHYCACDVRNKSIIDNLTMTNMSDTNVVSMFNKQKKKIAIIMDEIDGLNSGDKGGISSLISVIRPKKTKKQLLEPISSNPIICISTNDIDKKTKELIKVCHHYDFCKPTTQQICKIIDLSFKNIDDNIKQLILEYSQLDLRKIKSLLNIYLKDQEKFIKILKNNVFVKKSVIEISKDIVRTIIKQNIPINLHNVYINENERTIVALLWHENICDILYNVNKSNNLTFYYKLLNNLCYGDYIDRITFQKQIWQFNELSSFIKIMYNNFLMHSNYCKDDIKLKKNQEIRFTKVLTKYSTEFNNYCFFQNISNILSLDKKDIIAYFLFIRDNINYEQELIINYDIKELDIQRIYRYIDTYLSNN